MNLSLPLRIFPAQNVRLWGFSAITSFLIFCGGVYFFSDPLVSLVWDVECATERDAETESAKEGQEKEPTKTLHGIFADCRANGLLVNQRASYIEISYVDRSVFVKDRYSRGPPSLCL